MRQGARVKHADSPPILEQRNLDASVAPSGPRPLRLRLHPDETAAWGSPSPCVRELAVARRQFVGNHRKRDRLHIHWGNSVPPKQLLVLEVPNRYIFRRGTPCTDQHS